MNRLLKKRERLFELMEPDCMDSIPKSLVLAAEKHLDKCIHLLTPSDIKKKTKKMPASNPATPNSRLQKQVEFPKKRKSKPRKNESAAAVVTNLKIKIYN